MCVYTENSIQQYANTSNKKSQQNRHIYKYLRKYFRYQKPLTKLVREPALRTTSKFQIFILMIINTTSSLKKKIKVEGR